MNEAVRKRIATEILETEKTYVKALDVLIQVRYGCRLIFLGFRESIAYG